MIQAKGTEEGTETKNDISSRVSITTWDEGGVGT